MSAGLDPARARRYLLGLATEEEGAALEREYFERDDVVERIAAAEDDLIEDYLAGQLETSERERFERSYLAAPHHRVRVDTVQRLMARAAQLPVRPASAVAPPPAKVATRYMPWLALAASLLVGAGAWWMFVPSGRDAPLSERRSDSPSQPPPPAGAAQAPTTPRVFALSLSPVAVRGSGDSLRAVLPAATDIVALELQGDGESRSLAPTRAAIRTVAGLEVWRGPAAVSPGRPAGVLARIDVPAAHLPADDYLVSLFGRDGAGAEVEWAQYFLRLRNP
jgi:hypothetical protein